MLHLLSTASSLLLLLTVLVLLSHRRTPPRHSWLFPASLSLGYLMFSLYVVVEEGLFGFFADMSRTLWGAQIWLDLMFAGGLAFAALLPQMRKLNMRPWLWALAMFSSGSIGLLALAARVLYLRQRSVAAVPA